MFVHLFNIKFVEGLKPQKPQEHILSRVKKWFPFLTYNTVTHLSLSCI